MEILLKFLQEGNLTALIIFALMLALAWTVKRWQQSEAEKYKLYEARLADVKEMVALATEVKNSIATLVSLAREK